MSDARGAIQPLVDADFRSAQLISSVAGSVRANHYHKNDWHYMYLVSGAFNYYHRPVGSVDEPTCVRFDAGQMVFTPPMLEHAVEFLEDTVFINFSGSQRDQATYEADVVRIDLVQPKS